MTASPIRACWLATAVLLAAYWCGWTPGLAGAIVLTALQTLAVSTRRRTWRSLDVQVLWLYLGLLLLGALPGLRWIHAIQSVGLLAMLTIGYCPAVRLLVLMPWNRPVPLSWSLVARAVTMPPGPGPIAPRLWP